jgi:hypothetical protein
MSVTNRHRCPHDSKAVSEQLVFFKSNRACAREQGARARGFNLSLSETSRMPLTHHNADSVIQKIEQQLEKNNIECSYLSSEMLPSLFQFGEDRKKRSTPINKLDNQHLIQLYEKNWNEMR